jgi:hypothetical protein
MRIMLLFSLPLFFNPTLNVIDTALPLPPAPTVATKEGSSAGMTANQSGWTVPNVLLILGR